MRDTELRPSPKKQAKGVGPKRYLTWWPQMQASWWFLKSKYLARFRYFCSNFLQKSHTSRVRETHFYFCGCRDPPVVLCSTRNCSFAGHVDAEKNRPKLQTSREHANLWLCGKLQKRTLRYGHHFGWHRTHLGNDFERVCWKFLKLGSRGLKNENETQGAETMTIDLGPMSGFELLSNVRSKMYGWWRLSENRSIARLR